MEVIIFHGSPRRRGNTAALLEAVGRGMEAAGGRVELIRICDLRIQPCIGCGGCAKTGECVLDDDMQQLYPRILRAQRLVLGSPIYFYGLTSQAKAFVDRNQALWSRKQLLRRQGAWAPDPGRKGFLVSVGATHGEKLFDGAILCARYAFDAMGLAYGGELLVRGKDEVQAVRRDSSLLARAETVGRRFMGAGPPPG